MTKPKKYEDFESKGKQTVGTVKKPDPLEEVANEEERRKCTHPNLQFTMWGYRLTCVDCKRRWIAANDKFELPDYTYCNPRIEGEFRHSPNEMPRREELKKPAKKG